ncbi:MAG: GNAT family protein [Bacteroidota bacterium]
MNEVNLKVREVLPEEIPRLVDYFHQASPEYLIQLGADIQKLPPRDEWVAFIEKDQARPYPKREFYYLIWERDGQAIGHNNINKLQYGKEAYMHLHLWDNGQRQKGLGQAFLRQSIPLFFQHFELEALYCEPHAHNPAPNRTLPKLGFRFIKEYETTPGFINFHQLVRRYVLKREDLAKLSDG